MRKKPAPQHIIAIGASAGGIEALFTFFDCTPVDSASYVVIQHLSPDHQSRLAELLANHSPLQIKVARHNATVQTNQVYVIPHQSFMTIRGGKLQLTAKRGQKGPHRTVDTFFTSLAADQGEQAIGIILSGMGTDGSEGIRAIKQAGGLVIVQDPATAAHEGMPAHALATGLADAVLAPQAMPAAIASHVHPEKDLGVPASDERKESEMEAILNLIKRRLPLDFSDYKRATIFRRIRRRMAHHRIPHSEAYLRLLQDNALELETLAKDFLISVTAFFRDPAAFEILERDVIPAILNKAGTAETKIWVAGCATGEEAYSIAILVTECLARHHLRRPVRIFATDLDKAALEVASRGEYSAAIEQQVLPERLSRFFTREGGTYRVQPSLRRMIVFAQHDLGRNPPYCHVDLISCRNLLIYLNASLQRKIFAMLHFGLLPGGYLLLGTSENATLLQEHVREVSKRWKIYQKTSDARHPVFEAYSLPLIDEGRSVASPVAPATEPASRKVQWSKAVLEEVLGESGQAGVVVDEALRVEQSFGDLSPYVLPRVFNLNLPDLLPEPLVVAFGAAVHRATRHAERVVTKGIRLTDTLTVNLLVKPLVDKRSAQKRFLVVFSRETSQPAEGPSAEWFDPGEHTRAYVRSLEEELRQVREQLQAAQEKMVSSQENLLSFNEELLSANEEMQSTNEEMQSVNEELQTLNAEYQVKNRELSELNDDLTNYFRSNVGGQLFVDRELRLKKFSPSAVEHINLREGDIGRPLHHLTNNIRFDTLMEDLRSVLATGESLSREVQATRGQWYQVRVMPYLRQSDNGREGVMVTFYDITELVSARQQAEQAQRRLRLMTDALPVLIGYLDSEQKYRFANRAYEAWFHQPAEALLGQPVWAVIGEEAYQGVKGYIDRALSGEQLNFEARMPYREDFTRYIRTTYVPDIHAGEVVGFYTLVTDVTEQVQARKVLEESRRQSLALAEALEKANQALTRTNVDLDTFVYAASHGLRAPISRIKGLLDLLTRKMDGQLDESTVHLLGLANTSVTKLLGVMGDLTEIAHVQQDTGAETEPLSLREMLAEVVSEIQEPISESAARLVTNLEMERLVYPRKHLRSILLNLLSNAIKYRSSERPLEIRLTFGMVDAQPVLVVADNGLGLKPEQVARLFTIYKRFHSHVYGSGLGLYMIKRMVENNGGRIEVTSQEGQGSTFTVYLSPATASLGAASP